MALIQIEFKDNDFKEIMEDLRTAEELTFKAHRNLSALGVVSVGTDPNRDEIPQEEKEKAELYLMQLSMILKDVLTDKYLPKPVAVDICDKDKPYMKDLAVRSLMYAMRKLADGLNLDETLEHTLILFESDLERFGYVLRKNDSYKLTEQDLQEALNEEFPTDPQILQCHSETIQGLIVNLIMGAGLNQFDINKQTRMFLISALMYGRAALMAAPDLSHEIEREIEALRGSCKRYYDPEEKEGEKL